DPSCTGSDCATNPSTTTTDSRFTKRFLLARAAPPTRRVHLFVNSYPPTTACGAAILLSRMFSIGCDTTTPTSLAAPTEPHDIESPADLPALGAWAGLVGRTLKNALWHTAVTGVPSRVVTDIQQGTPAMAGLAGTHGEDIAKIENQIEAISSTWTAIQTDV